MRGHTRNWAGLWLAKTINERFMKDESKRILIVEDDQMLRDTLVTHLSEHYGVEAVGNGEDALRQVEALRPSAIILDLLLPKMDGFQVLMRIRDMKDEQLSKIPVLIVSNLKDPESIMRAESLGVQAYLPKADIDLNTLVTQIRKVFET